ncbi:MAG: hypothetical protein HRT73_04335 [Flavobacteriales bacterium]|uniref:hypothetical protein n=1 Tax=Chromohalobacter israelensis TaxID=141390 RepID=UPI003D7BDE9F|nr:hypothetical protein [Flavobacteriales bacterium]
MANDRVAQFQRDIIEAITAYAWEVRIAAGYDLKVGAVSEVGSGKPHVPEKQRLAEIIDRLNDLCGAEVGDDDKLHFANGIADRNERDEAMMAQVRNHSEDQVMHGLFPKKVTDAVFDALSNHKKLSMPLLENEKTGRPFALLILKMLAGRGVGDVQPSQVMNSLDVFCKKTVKENL